MSPRTLPIAIGNARTDKININQQKKEMFIISLSYKVPLQEIDRYLDDHVSYLNKQYEIGNFILSGRKVPRNGGIIISNMTKKSEIEKIIDKDPFKINNLSDYEIIEVQPTKVDKKLDFLLDHK